MKPNAAQSEPDIAVSPACGVAFPTVVRGIFLQWEKLRPLYVAALTVASILMVGPRGLMTRQAFAVLVMGALASNILYFAGPLVEAYVAWLGYRPKWLRWCLFVGGTVLSVFLAIATLIGTVFTRFD